MCLLDEDPPEVYVNVSDRRRDTAAAVEAMTAMM